MNSSRCSFLASLLFLVLGLQAQMSIDDWASDELIANAHTAFEFRELDSDKVIATHQAQKLLNPASTIKLITSFIFLDKFGENYQFETSIHYRGELLKDGTLEGDLIIKGTGDPSFASNRYGSNNNLDAIFTKILGAILKAGISCIDGDIIVDASAYGTDCVPHSWQFNDLGNYYSAGVWNLNYNENSYELGMNSMDIKSGVKLQNIYPYASPFNLKSELRLGAKDSGDEAYIFCAPFQTEAYVRGSIPRFKKNFSIKGSIPDPPTWFAKNLLEYLALQNISAISARSSYEPQKSDELVWNYKGVPAEKLVKSAIKKSVNLYCEAFLLKLGEGDREVGIKYELDYLKNKKIIPTKKSINISDGSGLSQRNFITANSLVLFLKDQYKQRGQQSMFSYLSRNGYDGTLRNSFKSSSLKGKIYGKSGSMAGVRAYAGFMKSKSGKVLVFSIMVNNYTTDSSKIYRHIEKLLESIYEQN